MTVPDICRTCRIHNICRMQENCTRTKAYREKQDSTAMMAYVTDRRKKIERRLKHGRKDRTT